MKSDIIIVSGLPRSGTSLMMQMLENGGLPVVKDDIRTADVDNPRGYYEFEKVKKIKEDASWLPDTRGKAFKMVSQLLYELPPDERYRVIFMERNLDEMLLSQEKMLKRLGRRAAPRAEMKRSYTLHLDRLHEWFRRQRHVEVLNVSYNQLIEHPTSESQRVSQFLEGKVQVERMASVVDPSLYRNRRSAADHPHNPAG